jgi:hypothetical protein
MDIREASQINLQDSTEQPLVTKLRSNSFKPFKDADTGVVGAFIALLPRSRYWCGGRGRGGGWCGLSSGRQFSFNFPLAVATILDVLTRRFEASFDDVFYHAEAFIQLAT